jgi:hypothetical protein
MSLVDSMGTTLLVQNQAVMHGSTITFSSYLVATSTDGGKNVDFDDIDDANGATAARLIFKRQKKFSFELICRADAAPTTDFPEGDMCALSGLTACYVDSAKVSKSKSAAKVAVELTDLGIT